MTRIPAAMALIAISAVALGRAHQAQPPATPPPTPPATTAATPAAPQAPTMDESHRVSADEIDKLLAEGKVLLLDVREPKELEDLGTIEGSLNIPVGQLENRLSEVPKDRLILTA
jgi:hypothetical protein